MKNLFKVTLLFLLVTASFQPVAKASNQLPAKADAPEVILTLNVFQSGPGQFSANWTSTCNLEGGYLITLIDETGGGSVPIFSLRFWPGNSITLGGYQVGHTYRFVVTDCDSTQSQVFTITY